MDLVERVYVATRAYPAEERFGMTSQSRRAAVSIPCNIAEGFGRSGRADFVHFLDMSMGSANELETLLLSAVRLQYLAEAQARPLLDWTTEVQRILKGLIQSLGRTQSQGLRDRAGRKDGAAGSA